MLAKIGALGQTTAMGQTDDSTVMYLEELLAPWSAIAARRMFSSWGLYRGALMFALVAEDVTYFKCGDHLRQLAAGRKLTLFSYAKRIPQGKTKTVSLNYAALPPDVLEDGEQLIAWAEAAWQDAIAARRGAPKGIPEQRPRHALRRRT